MPFRRIPAATATRQRTPDWGDVYWFDFGYPVSAQRSFAGVHPAIVISDAQLVLAGTVLVIPMSGMENQRPGYLFHIPVTQQECPFLDKDSIAKADQVYCVLSGDLVDQYYLGTVPTLVMRRIYDRMVVALGFRRFRS